MGTFESFFNIPFKIQTSKKKKSLFFTIQLRYNASFDNDARDGDKLHTYVQDNYYFSSIFGDIHLLYTPNFCCSGSPLSSSLEELAS